ncbi:uncharacterized protein LOC129609453 [Condylostylus longicornis]|uniref:uncharacterized protein LOC129609453 n=1 Tax=Condylostylus longicornis TaxID=2530218 RepID=UPI00244E3569|nr:uncharacterized protein LOC129609453 [Condylostylus longicornis]
MATSGDYMFYEEDDDDLLELESIFNNIYDSSLTSKEDNTIEEENCEEHSKFLPIYEDPSKDDNEIAIKLLMNRLRDGLNLEMEYLERKEILNTNLKSPITISSSIHNNSNEKIKINSSDFLISSSEISSIKPTTCCATSVDGERVIETELNQELKNLYNNNDSNLLNHSMLFENNDGDNNFKEKKYLRESQESPDLFVEYDNNELNQINGNKCGVNDEDDDFFCLNNFVTSMITDDDDDDKNNDNKSTDTYVEHNEFMLYNLIENDVNNVAVQDDNNITDDKDDDGNDYNYFDDLYCLQKRKKYLIECIEELMKSLVKNFKETGDVSLSIDNTSKWDNIEFSEQMLAIRNESVSRNISINNEKTKFRFTLINYLLNEILKRLLAGITCTLRELYYQDPELCQDPIHLTKALHDICCLLQCTPWELGIHSSSKGLVCGSLLISILDNIIIDCSIFQMSGFLLPKATETIDIIDCNAEFILLVEKDTIFDKLIQQKIFNKINKEFILITGKGYPDINTRLLLRKILNKYNIPVYALMDADPYGIEIMLTYSYGSKELSFMSHCLACPEIQWIGVLPSEIELLGIPSIQLTNEDKIRINDLLKRPYLILGKVLLDCGKLEEAWESYDETFNRGSHIL